MTSSGHRFYYMLHCTTIFSNHRLRISPTQIHLNLFTGLGVMIHESWLIKSRQLSHDSWWPCKIVHWVKIYHQKISALTLDPAPALAPDLAPALALDPSLDLVPNSEAALAPALVPALTFLMGIMMAKVIFIELDFSPSFPKMYNK